MWAYTAFLNNKRYASIKLFVTSTLLFHSMYFYVPVLFAALFFHAGIFRRDKLKFLLVLMAAVIVLNGPWLVWLGAANFSSISEKKALDAAKASEYMRIYIFDIFRYVFPVWLLAFAALAAIVSRWRNGPLLRKDSPFWEKLSLPLLFVIFNCMAMSAAAPGPFFRYIAPSVPLIIILSAVVVNAALDMHLLFGVAAVVLLLITSHLKDYFYEISHDYDGPEEGISLYLNKYGSPEDIVVVNNGDMALKFYTKMRIISGLTGEDLTPVKNARWVILRKNLISHRYIQSRDYIRNNISRDKYREIVIDYPDIQFENRENLGDHLFRTSSTKDKVKIWERID